jgi:hypothetical protein
MLRTKLCSGRDGSELSGALCSSPTNGTVWEGVASPPAVARRPRAGSAVGPCLVCEPDGTQHMADEEEADAESPRATMQRRVRLLSNCLGSAAEADLDDVMESARLAVEQASGQKQFSAVEVSVVETMLLLARACFCRAALRELCEFHGWRRLRKPDDVPWDEELETCPGCTSYCAVLADERVFAWNARELFDDAEDLGFCPCGYGGDLSNDGLVG